MKEPEVRSQTFAMPLTATAYSPGPYAILILPLLIVFKKLPGKAKVDHSISMEVTVPRAPREPIHISAGKLDQHAQKVDPSEPDEVTLDQLLSEPIVRQLMSSDQADETTIRHLLKQTTVQRPNAQPERSDAMNVYPIGWTLYETARLWRKSFDRKVGAKFPGMTRARCAMLICLARYEGVNQAALAQIVGVKPITLSRTIDRLEAAGFVVRAPTPEDRRCYVLRGAAKAEPIVAEIQRLAAESYEDGELGLTSGEVRHLYALLSRVSRVLKQLQAQQDPLKREGNEKSVGRKKSRFQTRPR